MRRRHNIVVDRTVGSRLLALAGHRKRYVEMGSENFFLDDLLIWR